MFKRYLLAITFCLSSIFFFSGILYSTTQKIIKLDTHSKNTTAFIATNIPTILCKAPIMSNLYCNTNN